MPIRQKTPHGENPCLVVNSRLMLMLENYSVSIFRQLWLVMAGYGWLVFQSNGHSQQLVFHVFDICSIIKPPGCYSLRIQVLVCPKKGISPTILFWGWDLDHQSYEFSGGVWILTACIQSRIHITRQNPEHEKPQATNF